MNPDIVHLHEFLPGQGVSDDALERLRAQRLHVFEGRALGEDEFDRLQAWTDARIAGFESAFKDPGILHGLDCRLHSDDGHQIVEIQPGSGLGRDGELHNLTASLQKPWESLSQAYRALPGNTRCAVKWTLSVGSRGGLVSPGCDA